MSDQPWICPKCGRVYGPIMPACAPCNNAREQAWKDERARRSLGKPIKL